jgi:long-subunit acyl-CoA synthetase (AMP-forming)
MNDFNRIAKNMELKYYEKINKVFLEPIPWETDDVFAPALKLKRGVLDSRYDEIIVRLSLET